MWIMFAVGAAFFAGLTSILAKCGIKNTDSDVATALRTVVVLIFAWVMVFVAGSFDISGVDTKTWIFLILSGLATGFSWLCYFKALQLGDVNKVVPIDKSSVILTIILAFLFLGESITALKFVGILAIAAGTFLMIIKKTGNGNPETEVKRRWIVYAVLSAVFASLTSILGKLGISGVESNLGTAIRTCVVLVMAWIVVAAKGKMKLVLKSTRKELLFISLSGLATGGSWLCYYKALQDGVTSAVVMIDKLSIVITVLFSYFVFKEKLNKKSAVGLILIITGTITMLF